MDAPLKIQGCLLDQLHRRDFLKNVVRIKAFSCCLTNNRNRLIPPSTKRFNIRDHGLMQFIPISNLMNLRQLPASVKRLNSFSPRDHPFGEFNNLLRRSVTPCQNNLLALFFTVEICQHGGLLKNRGMSINSLVEITECRHSGSGKEAFKEV
ncbi:hypothetical protein D3C85_1190010 [compost metagenome]